MKKTHDMSLQISLSVIDITFSPLFNNVCIGAMINIQINSDPDKGTGI